MERLVEQQLWDDWCEWMNPEVKLEPPAMKEKEEQQEVKQESEDVPVSCSKESNAEPVLCNPKGKVYTLAEHSPAAIGHQHQPPTGLMGLWGLLHRTTASKASLQIHKQLADKAPSPTALKKTFVCTTCSKVFSSEKVLAHHRRKVHNERPYKCQPCGKTFRTLGCLLNHSRIHRNTSCTYPGCGKVFLKSKYLKKHMKTHRTNKPYQCSICGKKKDMSYLTMSKQSRARPKKTKPSGPTGDS